MYIAKTYIGGKYTPGEILPDNLPVEEVKWLLEAGAIRMTAPDPAANSFQPDPEKENKSDSEETAAEETDENGLEDEIDEEAEVPEIDVMDGLVANSAKTEPTQTARSTARKPLKKAGKGGSEK